MGLMVEGRPEYPDEFVFGQGAGIQRSGYELFRVETGIDGPDASPVERRYSTMAAAASRTLTRRLLNRSGYRVAD
jgi:hypothetical protein